MSKKFALTLLFIFICFFIFANYIFIQYYDVFAWKDAAYHATQGARIFHVLTGTNKQGIVAALAAEPSYPPFYYLVSAIVRIIFGFKYVFMTSSLFLIILLYGIYKIGEYMKDRAAGLLSAAVLSFYPVIYTASRVFDLELAQTAISVMIFYFLLRISRFRSLAYSLGFGLLLAAGLLLKQSIVFFIAGPLCAVFFCLLLPMPGKKTQLRNFLLSLSLAFLAAFLVYYKRYFFCPSRIMNNGIVRLFMNNEESVLVAHPYYPRFMAYYLISLGRYYLGAVNLIFFLIALPYFFYDNKNARHKIFLIVWLVVPFCILTAITSKFFQYFIPCVPFFALITGLGLSYIRPRAVRRVFIIIFFALNILIFTYANSILFPKAGQFISSSEAGRVLVRYSAVDALAFPEKKINPVYAAAEYLNKVNRGKAYKAGFLYYLTDDNPPHQGSYFTMLLELYNNRSKLVDLIRYSQCADISRCDFFIFLDYSGRGGKWLDSSMFYRDFKDAAKANFHCAEKFILVEQENTPLTNEFTYLSKKNIDTLIGYLPQLKLMQVVGSGDKMVLVYKKIKESK